MVGTEKLSRVLWWLILNAKKKNRPDGALDRNTAQLSIGTAMHSGSEHRKTGRVFSYLLTRLLNTFRQ